MAEAWANHLLAPHHSCWSAGLHPQPLSPLALRAMQEVGIDITSYRSKGLAAIPWEKIDYCILVDEGFPALKEANADEQAQMEILRDVRDELELRAQSLSVYLQAPLENATKTCKQGPHEHLGPSI